MAKHDKKNAPAAPAVPEGYAQLETAGQLDGEWVTPKAGTIIEGQLIRAFNVEQDDGKVTAAYAIRDADGACWLVGERASFAQSMRAQTIGTTVYLRFDRKEDLLDKNGKKTSRTIWRTTLGAKNAGRGPVVAAVLSTAAPQKKEGDVPF